MDVSKENVCINKLIGRKKELIFVEEDMIVPDSKPDILNAINLSGNVCIYKKEVLDGKIKIEGCVNTYIMYLPDSKEDNIRGLNANIDFSEIIPMQESKEGMNASINVDMKDLECKVINGRKINVRAGIEVKIKLYSNDEVEIINEINSDSNLQILDKDYTINSLFGKNSTRVYVKENINVDEKNEIAEILKVDICLENNDKKISYNKVLSKCEINIRILYLTEDNRVESVEGRIPAVGFIDMQDVTEDNICDIENEINNITIKPNSSDEHSIYVEIEIETSCNVFENKEIRLIQDLYSPISNIDFSQRKINTTIDKIEKVKNFTLTSKTNIPELEGGYLIDTQSSVIINKEQLTETELKNSGDVFINFIFANSNNSINSKTSKIPFEVTIENPTQKETIDVETSFNIIGKKFDVKPNGDIDCTLDIEARAEFYQTDTFNIIENIEESEIDKCLENYDSLILYIVQKGDTLWKIAKKFRSTVDDIVKANGIEEPNIIIPGQKIYIPKFR